MEQTDCLLRYRPSKMIDVINEQISGFPLASFLVGELKHVILSHAGSYRKKCHSIFSSQQVRET